MRTSHQLTNLFFPDLTFAFAIVDLNLQGIPSYTQHESVFHKFFYAYVQIEIMVILLVLSDLPVLSHVETAQHRHTFCLNEMCVP